MGNQVSAYTLKHLKNYQQVSNIDQGFIYRQKVIDQISKQQIYEYFILKVHNYSNQLEFNDAYKRFKEQIINKNSQEHQSSILNIRQAQKQQIHHFCSNSYKIYTLYEYPELNLRNQIQVRATLNKYFEQQQLVAILQTCILSLQQIRASICFNTKSIFICPDGVIKVLHNDLVDENYRHFLTENIYYAPEKLSEFGSDNISENSVKKQFIFSIGMVLLEACCLEELYQLYDYNQKVFDDKSLENKIYKLSQRYSTDLLELLSNMLQINPNRRISLLEIQRVLNRYEQSTTIKEGSKSEEKENRQNIYCQQFEKSKDKSKTQQLASSMNEPSVPNLLNQQNNSRLSLNNRHHLHANYENHQTAEGYNYYKNTPNYSLNNIMPSSNLQTIHNITANFSTGNTKTKTDEKLFTDPKLLEMIRKDLDDIHRSRTSRINNGQNQRNDFSIQKQNGYQSLSNCPQVQSLAASVFYESNSNNKEQNSSKNYPQDFEKATLLPINNLNFSQSNISSSGKFQKTIRQPLGEINYSNHKNTQVDQLDYKLNMKKKKQSNLIYLQEIYQDGVKYQGMSQDGLKQGKGKLIYNDGAYYEGQFKSDRINGYGILYYCENRPAYNGMWQNEQFHGEGKLFNEDPEKLTQQFPYHNFNLLENYWIKYEGEFQNDNKHGKGRIYLTSQQFIEGQFFEDMVHGWNKFNKRNGEIIEGRWENNILVEQKI